MQFSTLLLSSLAIFAVSAAPTPGDTYPDRNGYPGGSNSGGGNGNNSGGGNGGSGTGPQQVCCNSESSQTSFLQQLTGLAPIIPLPILAPVQVPADCFVNVAGGPCNNQVGTCIIDTSDPATCNINNINGIDLEDFIPITLNL